MNKTLTPIRTKTLYEQFLKERKIISSRLEKFTGCEGKDVYNPSVPFTLQGKTYILGRVENRGNEFSEVHFFEKNGDEWQEVKGATVFKLQDPSVAVINGKTVITGINVNWGDDVNSFTDWKTDFFTGTEIDNFKYFASGPAHMKDVRILGLPCGKVGVLTRPQGANHADFNCIAKIGYTELNCLEEISPENLEKAHLFDGLFLPDEWGGPNGAYLLNNGLIGVIGHKSYKEIIGGEDILHYYGTAFAINPDTLEITQPKIIISRNCFPYYPPKRERISDVTFTAGIVRNSDGTATIYSGLSDSAIGSAVIPDPFTEYEKL